MEGNVAEAQFGASLAFVDVDGDFLSDVVVGSPLYAGARGPDQGRFSIFRATLTGMSNTPALVLDGERSGIRYGSMVGAIDDLNADGIPDLAIAAPGWRQATGVVGAVDVHLGTELGLESRNTWRLVGGELEAGFGLSVASAGDINDDSFIDFAIGAPGAIVQGLEVGRVYVCYGNEVTPGERSSEQLVNLVIDGREPGAAFGLELAPLDANDDFRGELMVGAPAHTKGEVGEGLALQYRLVEISTGVETRDATVELAVTPNPARTQLAVTFALPAADFVRLALVDVSGRRIVNRAISLGAGTHRIDVLEGAPPPAPGVYFVRLERGREIASARVAIVR
jgi:hypothetical protein